MVTSLIKTKTILEGHYTLESMSREIEIAFEKLKELKLPTKITTTAGAMVIYNLENKKIRLDSDLANFLGITPKLKFITCVKRLGVPIAYFLHCDLV